MRRRTLLRGVCLAAGTSVAGCLDRDRGGPTYENPVFEPILADPSVHRAADGEFYAYGTADDWRDGEGTRVVPIVRSSNLVDWEYVGEAFESTPDWKEYGNVWAPMVVRRDGRYLMYYSLSTWGDENPGIGIATSDDPGGRFEDRGELFTSEEIGVENSIDPFFYEDDGTPYLFWGSFHGIYGVELESDGTTLAGEPFQIAGDRFEATYLYERDGRYYFFGSTGSCCEGPLSTYRVEVGRADSLRGPYVNAQGRNLMTFGGEVVVDDGAGFVGPGHNSMVVDDRDTEWLVYHAYVEGNEWIDSTPRRALMLDPLQWEDGWPRVESRVPSTERSGPVFDE
ncbi:family 43 glycosylhydrolase [Haloprofundus salilacus]|uniref:family 43 glycosylhydrolase n=1 Tax=Haloprofundus salilacus TaxID=2876190 RepID=UPI001CCB57E9|nr:family 43 glycosylhydrolase [Haloprofundus salilacus]